MVRVSVGVVTYNSADKVGPLLRCLLQNQSVYETRILVVDNASRDDTVRLVREEFPQAELIALPDNRGFGAGHNQVMDRLTSDYHLVINPDITFDTDVITPLVDYMESHPEVAAVTPHLLNPDGTAQQVPRRTPKFRYMVWGRFERLGGIFRRWRGDYTMRGQSFDEPTDITFCTGCFMLMRTDLFKKEGGFDERFFMYCEDADLTRRLLRYGKVQVIPSVQVIHEWERGSSKSIKLWRIHVSSMFRYFKKWRGVKDGYK